MPGFGCLKSCLGKVVLLLLLVAAAVAGWRWGPAVFPRVVALFPDGPEVFRPAASPELAEETMDRFEALRRGEVGGQLALSAAEIESVIRYSVPGLLPPGVSRPRVEMKDGVATVKARVAVDAFPDLPDLQAIVGFLPDTLDVTFEGALEPLDDKHWEALVVHRVEAGVIPLPRRMIPEILKALGREDVQGLPRDAIGIPIPDGLRTAFVLGDSLVLVRDP